VDASGFQGVLAPAGTPPEAVAKLSDALNKALAQPEVRERFAAAGLDVASSSPAEFAAFIRSEIAKWGPRGERSQHQIGLTRGSASQPASGGRVLCEPSQKGCDLVRLQPQSHTFCASLMVNLTGLNSVSLCDPSQKGWRRERPQRHHQ
jgi:hypothetical protein